VSTQPPRDDANDLHQDPPAPAAGSRGQDQEAPAEGPDAAGPAPDATGADADPSSGPAPGLADAPGPEEPAGTQAPESAAAPAAADSASATDAYAATYGEDEPAAGTGTTPASGAAGAAEPAAEPTDRFDPAEGQTPAATTPVAPAEPVGPAGSAPSAEEDEALRAERARRFGKFGRRTEEDDLGEPIDGEVRTTALPAGEPAGADTSPAGQPVAGAPVEETVINEENPFEDWDDPPRSRASAHWWGALIALVFTPVAWYLLADGGERWVHSQEVNPDAIHFGALVEIAGGLLALAAVLLATRWSSVGAIIIGSIGTLIGAAFLAIPQILQDFLADYNDIFGRLGQFGQNVYNHLLADGNAGRILAYGVVLIFAGVISHGARRQGRREERRRAAAEL